jgi:hypothetical protein
MSFKNSSLGGSDIKGISPKQTATNCKTSDDVRLRRIVTKAWNTSYASGSVNGYGRAIGEFRAVNNLGDFLSREHYNCGGVNPENVKKPGWKKSIGSMFQNCDGTNVPPSTCNTKFVSDSSDYITYRKQRSVNRLYNDNSFVGDESHASYPNYMYIHRR